MKIRPMQQIADHIVGSRPILCGILAVIDEEIKALKWRFWHGQVERAICVLEKIVEDVNEPGRRGDFSATRLNRLGQQLLTYIRSYRTALVGYGARSREGRPHFDQPGGIHRQFLGCEKDGQKPANALVPLGR